MAEVFKCAWENNDRIYSCWVKARPELRATGISLQAADAELIDKIIEQTGDFQPLLEYVPSLPPTAFDDLFRGPDICAVTAPNELMSAANPWSDLFHAPICPLCQKGKDSR